MVFERSPSVTTDITYGNGNSQANFITQYSNGSIDMGVRYDNTAYYIQPTKVTTDNVQHTYLQLTSTGARNEHAYIFMYQAFSYDVFNLESDLASSDNTDTAYWQNKYQSLIQYERYNLRDSVSGDDFYSIKTAFKSKISDEMDVTAFPLKNLGTVMDYYFDESGFIREALINVDILEDYVIESTTQNTIKFYNSYIHRNSTKYYVFWLSNAKNIGIMADGYFSTVDETLSIQSYYDINETSGAIEGESVISEKQTFNLKKRGTAPTSVTISSVTNTTIQVNVETNMEYYRAGTNHDWIFDTNGLFSGLTPGETYVIFGRAKYVKDVQSPSSFAGNDNLANVEVTTTTKLTQTATPDITIVEITDSSFRIIGESGVEYSLDGYSFDISGTITNLEEDSDYTVYARYAETDTYYAGPTVSRTIHTQRTIEILRKKVLDQLEESYANHNAEGYTYVPGVYGSLRSQILAATTIDELNNLAAEIEPQMSFAASKDAGILAAKAKLKNSDSNFTEDDVNKEISKIEALEYGKDSADKITSELNELEELIEINRYKEEKLKAFCDYFNSLIKNDSNDEIGTLLVSFNTYYMNILSCTTKEAVDSAYNAAINGIK